MVTKLKPQAGRCLGLAFASFLVFTLLMSGAALAQARPDAEQKTSVKDEFLAAAHAAAAELGAEFGLSADDAASLADTLLFTAPDIEPGANMRRLMADLSATYGLEPQALFGFLQLYGTEIMAIGQDYGLVPGRGAGPGYGPRSAELARRESVGPQRRMAEAALVRDLREAGIGDGAAGGMGAGPLFPPLKQRVRPLPPDRAAKKWLERFSELRAGLPPRSGGDGRAGA